MRPFFPYYGSKWNIARRYPKPKHDIVIEPFAGSAGYSVFYGCENVILVEVDPIVAGIWRYLIAATPDNIFKLPDMTEVGDCVDNYDMCNEAKWLIGFWLNRGSASPKKSRTAYSARSDRSQLNWGPRAKERIASQIANIKSWTVIQGEYLTAPDIQATWFIDPPYVEKGKYYRKKFTDYERLGGWVTDRTGLVIACEGPGASWLPFEPLGNFKSSLGHAKEYFYLRSN